jgi:hypothetical protein
MELINFSAQELTPTTEPLLLPYIPANENGDILVGFSREQTAPEYISLAVTISPNIDVITVQPTDARKIQIVDAQPVATSVLKPYVFREPVQDIRYQWRPDIDFGTWTYPPEAEGSLNVVNASLFRSFSAKISIGAINAQRRQRNK